MAGARLVHDTLEAEGWDVEIADAQQVKRLGPLALKGITLQTSFRIGVGWVNPAAVGLLILLFPSMAASHREG
jgi:hypothetical protein